MEIWYRIIVAYSTFSASVMKQTWWMPLGLYDLCLVHVLLSVLFKRLHSMNADMEGTILTSEEAFWGRTTREGRVLSPITVEQV
jgi:hypothetical protein